MRSWITATSLVLSIAALSLAQPEGKKPPAFKLSGDEQKLLDLTNAEREKQKLPPFKANAVLFQVARAHSQNMAKKEKLDHTLDGKTPFDRMKEAKYEYQRAAENIAMSGGPLSMAEMLKLWMDSPGHRANILKNGYEEVGLGLASNGKGDVYATQVFGTPFKE